MANYSLSPQAQQSLRQIADYTFGNYGQRQNRKYLKLLRDRMQAVANNPTQGRNRSDIKIGYYSIQAEKHHIYYRLRASHVEIIDVLHQSMEPKRYL